MNYTQIEKFKSTIITLTGRGYLVKIPSFGIKGKVVGIGFKPYWTNPVDSKIEKLELNIMDEFGRMIPFCFYNIVGYDTADRNEKNKQDANKISMEIYVYSAEKMREKEPYDKVFLELEKE